MRVRARIPFVSHCRTQGTVTGLDPKFTGTVVLRPSEVERGGLNKFMHKLQGDSSVTKRCVLIAIRIMLDAYVLFKIHIRSAARACFGPWSRGR